MKVYIIMMIKRFICLMFGILFNEVKEKKFCLYFLREILNYI